MRTVIILLGGLLVWGAFVGIAKLVSGASPSSVTTATTAFVGVWFVAAASNMWIGVYEAGYSFKEELPIFLLIFLVPVAVAVFAKWKLL